MSLEAPVIPEAITEAAIRELAAFGFSDPEIAEHYGRSTAWAYYMRRKYKIPAALTQGLRPHEAAQAFGYMPGRELQHADRYAAYFEAHGAYPNFDAADVNRERRLHQAKRARFARAA